MGRVKDTLFRTCQVCGVEFLSTKSTLEEVMRDDFCSHRCAGEWRDVMEGIGNMQDMMLEIEIKEHELAELRKKTGS
jgi:hypothetical protein